MMNFSRAPPPRGLRWGVFSLIVVLIIAAHFLAADDAIPRAATTVPKMEDAVGQRIDSPRACFATSGFRATSFRDVSPRWQTGMHDPSIFGWSWPVFRRSSAGVDAGCLDAFSKTSAIVHLGCDQLVMAAGVALPAIWAAI